MKEFMEEYGLVVVAAVLVMFFVSVVAGLSELLFKLILSFIAVALMILVVIASVFLFFNEKKFNLFNSSKEIDDTEIRESSVISEVEETLKLGNQYIKKIRKLNNDIPSEKITKKIDYTEKLLKKIFEYVKSNPESASKVQKLLSYYLPTIVKLLESYIQADNQPVRTENIKIIKEEAKSSLDMFNTALENLLDDMFQNKALDISSDVSVLNVMLTKDGLKNDNKLFVSK